MKINQVIERECCTQAADFRPYKGKMAPNVERFKPHFCIYCGQIWVNEREMGPAGSMEPTSVPVKIDTGCWK